MLPLPSLCRDLLENLLAVQRYVGDRLPHAAGLALLQQLSLSPADVPDLSDKPAGEPPPRAHPENTTPVVGRMRKRTASVASLDLPEPSPRAARPSSRRRVAEP